MSDDKQNTTDPHQIYRWLKKLKDRIENIQSEIVSIKSRLDNLESP
jgi:hypothetical protein